MCLSMKTIVFFLQKNTDRELTQQAVELFIRKSAKYYVISGHD